MKKHLASVLLVLCLLNGGSALAAEGAPSDAANGDADGCKDGICSIEDHQEKDK